jgi:hypothetical protein
VPFYIGIDDLIDTVFLIFPDSRDCACNKRGSYFLTICFQIPVDVNSFFSPHT